MGDFAQFGKPHCGVDEIAKDDLPCFDIAGKKILKPLAQKRFAKTGIALNARLGRFLTISCQRHCRFLQGTGAVLAGPTS
jgi:hypothetical protein